LWAVVVTEVLVVPLLALMAVAVAVAVQLFM
jgi:hypothetical protein